MAIGWLIVSFKTVLGSSTDQFSIDFYKFYVITGLNLSGLASVKSAR